MDGAELFGKPIKVSFAKPLTKVDHGKAIWTSEEWIQAHIHDEGTAEPVQG